MGAVRDARQRRAAGIPLPRGPLLLGYARVSTATQDAGAQLAALEAAGCHRVWTEIASGARADRPELLDLVATARAGDVVVVHRLDRLGRSLRHLLDLVEGLSDSDVGLRVLAGAGAGLDTTGPAGRLIFSVFAAVAEYEREIIRERTRSGLRAARAKGRRGGRPPALDVDGLRQARALLQMRAWSMRDVAERVGISRSALSGYCYADGRLTERGAALLADGGRPCCIPGPSGVRTLCDREITGRITTGADLTRATCPDCIALSPPAPPPSSDSR